MEEKNYLFKILIAEDDTISQILLVQYLQDTGFSVAVAKTGYEVIDIYQKEKIDLILMVVRMPDLDGFSTVGMIRNHEKNTGKHVPVIAVTAFAIHGDREKCINAGMDDYITKPVNLDELSGIIAKWLVIRD